MIGARPIWVAAALAAIAVAIGFLIGYPAEVGAAMAIVLAACVSLITVRELAARAELRRRPARRLADERPLEQLRRVDEALTAARASAGGVNRHLRPLFRGIAATRLARRGVDVDRHPEEARAILGEELWELVRAERLRDSSRFEGGVTSAGLQSLIERLEQI
jgi:hypothetical protein